jgi:hypothetical protein
MTTRRDPIEWAVGLLRAGVLPSALPGRLMSEYGLSTREAHQDAQAALKLHQQKKSKDNGNRSP